MKHLKKYVNDYITLLFFDAGGDVTESMIFETEQDFGNYVINYVNKFMLEEKITYVWGEYNKNIIHDENGKILFKIWENAYDWFNEYNENTEPTLGYVEGELIKNVELDDRLKIILNTNKYNI